MAPYVEAKATEDAVARVIESHWSKSGFISAFFRRG